MTQLFRIELVPEAEAWRITLNDRSVGPIVANEHASAVFAWFMGYLEQSVAETAQQMGIGPQHIVTAAHEVPIGACPDCGKARGNLVPGVVENPCPRCRR
jgi:hypothetical protein